MDPLELLPMTPNNPLFMIVTGMDEEEVQIRAELTGKSSPRTRSW